MIGEVRREKQHTCIHLKSSIVLVTCWNRQITRTVFECTKEISQAYLIQFISLYNKKKTVKHLNRNSQTMKEEQFLLFKRKSKNIQCNNYCLSVIMTWNCQSDYDSCLFIHPLFLDPFPSSQWVRTGTPWTVRRSIMSPLVRTFHNHIHTFGKIKSQSALLSDERKK